MGIYNVRIVAKRLEDARKLDQMDLDIHRRGARRESPNRFVVPGLLTSEQLDQVKQAGCEVVVVQDLTNVGAQRRGEVSATNRFDEALTVAEMIPAEYVGYLNVEEVETAVINLAKHHSEVATIIELPNQTWEGRTSHAVRIGVKDGTNRMGVLFTGGVHAREWGGSDICVSFMNNLVSAYENKKPLQFGPLVYTFQQVKLIIERIWIYIFPDVNPDGKRHSQTYDDPRDPEGWKTWWRKNKNPNGTSELRKQGVDINRNFDFLWKSGLGTSPNPGALTYKGEEAFSEPETRNVKHFFDAYPDIRYYVDIHSYTGLVLYPWGDDNNQSLDPDQNFCNPAYDGKRGRKFDQDYAEFIPPSDLISASGMAQLMNTALGSVRGTSYSVEQGFGLYETSGTSSDYAYCRHMADPSKTKVTGFTIEFDKTTFIPEFLDMQKIIKEVNAAMTELCWIACAGERRS